MTITVPGYSTLTGQPETILHLLEESQMWDEATGDDYIDKVCEAVARTQNIRLVITGETYPERAKSLLHELARFGLIYIEKKEEE